MEIGSIVECINDNWDKHKPRLNMPVKGKFYTVIGTCEYGKGTGLYLEECCDLIGVTHNGVFYKYDITPFMESRFVEVEPAMRVIVEFSNKVAERAGNKLDWMLDKFERKLDIQMLQLKHGSNYVNEIIDAIICEIKSDRIIGYHEYGH